MGLKDALGKVVKGALDATDCDGEYGDLKWCENHHRGGIVAGPDWYGGKDMGGGHLPKSARESDRNLAKDQRLASYPDGDDPGMGYPKESGDWKPDGC